MHTQWVEWGYSDRYWRKEFKKETQQWSGAGLDQTTTLTGSVSHRTVPFVPLCLIPYLFLLSPSSLCASLIDLYSSIQIPTPPQSRILLVYSLTSYKVQAELPESCTCNFLIAHQLIWVLALYVLVYSFLFYFSRCFGKCPWSSTLKEQTLSFHIPLLKHTMKGAIWLLGHTGIQNWDSAKKKTCIFFGQNQEVSQNTSTSLEGLKLHT